MTIEKKLLGTNPVATGIPPEGVGFENGDYLKLLNQVSNFPSGGRADSLTFSCWFYITADNAVLFQAKNTANAVTFNVYVDNNGVRILATDEGTTRVSATVNSANSSLLYGWNHIVFSWDTGSTSTRKVYLNDIAQSTTWHTYTNALFFNDIDDFFVAGDGGSISKRLAHVFFDFAIDGSAYLDLSVLSNRRKFIDAEGLPVVPTGLSPYVYMELIDSATATTNSGSLGDFTVNGVLATAERGPNQDNCSASVFDGSADYLSRGDITEIADGKQFTLSCSIEAASTNEKFILGFGAGTTDRFYMYTANAGGGKVAVKVEGKNAAGTVILSARIGDIPLNSHVSIALSVDLTDTSKRYCTVDGVSVDPWDTYTNDTIDFYPVSTTHYYVGSNVPQNKKYEGDIGELYFDTTYTDLATDNPFWDSDTNRPNSVRKVIADTGVTPLIALPIIGSDAGNNLGSGGDFTVNSGPYTGARGGSEYWSRGTNLGTSAQENTFSKNLGVSTKIVTVVFASKPTSASLEYIASTPTGAPYTWFMINSPSNNYITIEGQNSTQKVLDSTASSSTSTQVNNEWNINFISFDLSDTSKRIHWLQNSARNNEVTRNYGTYINDTIDLSADDFIIGGRKYNSTARFSGDFGFTYVGTTFIDFSQEAERNKFVDQLGYPKDLTQQIEDGDIPSPLIYMKFDNTAALGTNSGTAGNLTVNGTPTAGADFNL